MSETTTQPPKCPECGEPNPFRKCLSCGTTRPLGWTGDHVPDVGKMAEPPPAPRRDGDEVQVGIDEAYPRVGVTVRGWSWFGLLRIRIYLDDGDWRTFWHVALWKFMFGVALPAAWVNAATKKATVPDGR